MLFHPARSLYGQSCPPFCPCIQNRPCFPVAFSCRAQPSGLSSILVQGIEIAGQCVSLSATVLEYIVYLTDRSLTNSPHIPSRQTNSRSSPIVSTGQGTRPYVCLHNTWLLRTFHNRRSTATNESYLRGIVVQPDFEKGDTVRTLIPRSTDSRARFHRLFCHCVWCQILSCLKRRSTLRCITPEDSQRSVVPALA